MQRCVVVNHDLIAENSIFSSDVTFLKPTDNSKTTAESPNLFMEHILNGSSVSFSRQVLVAYTVKQLVAISHHT